MVGFDPAPLRIEGKPNFDTMRGGLPPEEWVEAAIDALYAEHARISARHQLLMTTEPENPFENDSEIDYCEGRKVGLQFAIALLTGRPY